MMLSMQFILRLAMPFQGVTWLKWFTGYAFFLVLLSLRHCYKSVKKVTFVGHATVMTVVKNSALTKLTIACSPHFEHITNELTGY